ncbi:MAG: hypothetical protein NTX45_27805 [Proteobacteria bacterium]|nr:hypothetical protein [Pseudomonadota bacterium]
MPAMTLDNATICRLFFVGMAHSYGIVATNLMAVTRSVEIPAKVFQQRADSVPNCARPAKPYKSIPEDSASNLSHPRNIPGEPP